MDVDLGEMIKDCRFIGMQLSSRGSKALSDQGLTPIQARVLLYILKHSERGTSLTEIHRETGYTMAATSGLIKRLRENGYITMDAEGFITLNPSGEEIAVRIYTRHYLLTQFLRKLGVSEETAAADACKIEHDLSDETFEKITEHALHYMQVEPPDFSR